MQFVKDFSLWLSSSPYLNLVFLLLAIISVLVSFFLYFKSKKTKEPRYVYKNFSLIRNSTSALEGLNIEYNKEKIKTLTLTKFSFWNNGKDIINGTDIATVDKLRIELPSNEKIINVESTFIRKKANNVSIEIKENKAYINFDFLEYGDGAIFEIHHTSNSNSKVFINGTIKGAEQVKLGVYEKNSLLTNITGFLDEKLPEPENFLLKILYFAILVPIMIPIVFAYTPIEAMLTIMYKTPNEYNLLDEKNNKG